MGESDLSTGVIELSSKWYKLTAVIVIVVAVAICLTNFYLHRQFINDDAYISLRYAHNFLDGDGLVWNPGERAEGYSNFLHIILISGLGLAGIDLVLAARLINTLAFILMNILFLKFLLRNRSEHDNRDEPMLFLFPMILILNISPMISWIYGGLEGPLFVMLCSGGVLYFSGILTGRPRSRPLVISSLFFALAALTRPDGIIFAGASLIFLVGLLIKTRRLSIRLVLLFILPFAVCYLPYFIWRVNYYGELLPLTYYVKATGFSTQKAIFGLQYIKEYLLAPPFALALLILLTPIAIDKKFFDRRIGYLFFSVILYLIYVMLIGGDHMYSLRMLLPLMPITILLAYFLIRPLLNNIRLVFIIPAYIVVFGLIVLQLFWPETDVRKMSSIDSIGEMVGRHIARRWPEGSLVALNTAGSTPYFAPDHRFIDMLGLNDVHIAKRQIDSLRLNNQYVPGHAKGDGAYVLSREPDYIILGPAKGISIRVPWFLSDLEMQSDPRFHENYRIRREQLGEYTFTYYVRVK
jgi:hypothetical protein